MAGKMEELDLDNMNAESLMSDFNAAQKKPSQAEQEKQRKEAAAAQNEFRNAILSQVLDQNARARLSTIAVAKPEKAKMLENMIVNFARMGRISGKLSDEQFKQMLDQVNDQVKTKTTTVTFDRRRAALDSDED